MRSRRKSKRGAAGADAMIRASAPSYALPFQLRCARSTSMASDTTTTRKVRHASIDARSSRPTSA